VFLPLPIEVMLFRRDAKHWA